MGVLADFVFVAGDEEDDTRCAGERGSGPRAEATNLRAFDCAAEISFLGGTASYPANFETLRMSEQRGNGYVHIETLILRFESRAFSTYALCRILLVRKMNIPVRQIDASAKDAAFVNRFQL